MRGRNLKKTKRARVLRQQDNDAEALVWNELRNRRLNGLKFVRQLPIGPYFADFACREKLLVVEIDGSQHAKSSYDDKRNIFMLSNGWSVVRFWNAHVFTQKDSILNTIVEICEGRLSEMSVSVDMVFLPSAAESDLHEPSA